MDIFLKVSSNLLGYPQTYITTDVYGAKYGPLVMDYTDYPKRSSHR